MFDALEKQNIKSLSGYYKNLSYNHLSYKNVLNQVPLCIPIYLTFDQTFAILSTCSLALSSQHAKQFEIWFDLKIMQIPYTGRSVSTPGPIYWYSVRRTDTFSVATYIYMIIIHSQTSWYSDGDKQPWIKGIYWNTTTITKQQMMTILYTLQC